MQRTPKVLNPARDYGVTATAHSGQDHELVDVAQVVHVIDPTMSKEINDAREATARIENGVLTVGGIIVGGLSLGGSTIFGIVGFGISLASGVSFVAGYSGDDGQYVGRSVSTAALYERNTAEGISRYVVRTIESGNPFLMRVEVFPMDAPVSQGDLQNLCIAGY